MISDERFWYTWRFLLCDADAYEQSHCPPLTPDSLFRYHNQRDVNDCVCYACQCDVVLIEPKVENEQKENGLC